MGLLFPEEKKYCGNFFPEKNNYPTMTFSTIQKSHNIFFFRSFSRLCVHDSSKKKKSLDVFSIFTITTGCMWWYHTSDAAPRTSTLPSNKSKKNTPMVPPSEPTRRLFIEEPWIACRGAGGSVGCITHCQQQVYQLISINNLVLDTQGMCEGQGTNDLCYAQSGLFLCFRRCLAYVCNVWIGKQDNSWMG